MEYSHRYGGKTISVSINKDCEDIPADLVIPDEIDGYRVVALYQFDSPAIKSITLPDSVEVICAYAFEGAENLTTIKGGKNLNSIYNHAFKGCSSLKTFTISDNVKQLDKGMFEDCTSLESVYLNDNITELPESVFEGCTNLKTVTKLENITKIQNNCFAGCKSFKEFVISDKVEILGEKVFSDIDGLTVEYSSYPNRIKNIFDNCNNLTIRGYSGSSVERFAEYLNKNSNCTNVTFEAIDKKDAESGNENTPLSGDINNDGSINLKDAVLLRRYIAGGWNVTLDEKIADVNGDGTVNLKDVVMLRRFIAGGWGVTLGE